MESMNNKDQLCMEYFTEQKYTHLSQVSVEHSPD